MKGYEMELKPCPCCEGAAYVIPFSVLTAVRFYVQCDTEGAGCGLRTMKFRDEAEAIAAWNRRAGEPQ